MFVWKIEVLLASDECYIFSRIFISNEKLSIVKKKGAKFEKSFIRLLEECHLYRYKLEKKILPTNKIICSS